VACASFISIGLAIDLAIDLAVDQDVDQDVADYNKAVGNASIACVRHKTIVHFVVYIGWLLII